MQFLGKRYYESDTPEDSICFTDSMYVVRHTSFLSVLDSPLDSPSHFRMHSADFKAMILK